MSRLLLLAGADPNHLVTSTSCCLLAVHSSRGHTDMVTILMILMIVMMMMIMMIMMIMMMLMMMIMMICKLGTPNS